MFRLRALAGCLLALAALPALAQTPPLYLPQQESEESATTALPIFNNRSGEVEGFLLIEGGQRGPSSLDRILGRSSTPRVGAGLSIPLDNGRRVGTSVSLESNPTIGLLCDNSAVARSVGTLAQHCLVANLAPNPLTPLALSRPGVRAEATLEGDRSRVTASLGLNRFDAEGPLSLPGAALGATSPDLILSLHGTGIEQEDIGLLGEMRLGESGWVSIGGNLARARIVGAHQLPGSVRPQWNTGTLRLEGGIGDFGGEIVGRVIEIPGSTATYSNVGIGVTWRAPWQARLSVGAENMLSRGKNPFAGSAEDEEESSRVPYIRYEQDL